VGRAIKREGKVDMARIERIELRFVDIPPKVKRTDAIQSFSSQETPIVTVIDSDGASGTGYSYTIGTGGSSVMRLLSDHLAPRLIGRDAERVEAIWRELEFATHATTIGAISSLALAAIDIALWDLRAKRQKLPLWIVAGGAADRRPLYTTEGGWLHIDEGALIEDALAAREQGFTGSKIKIGRPHVSEDYRRLAAVRSALGPGYEIMTDANQGFALDEAIRRAGRFADLDLAWIEEPLPADDLEGHRRLTRATTTPIAVGESMYSIRHFREYMAKGACSIVQVDAARIGGVTPWLKVAHMAEAFDMPMCPHFLMELHVSLACAVSNGKYVEYIPQLDDLTTSALRIEGGMAIAPMTPGVGVEWDLDAVKAKSLPEFSLAFGRGAPS
jgi:L-alanine-DL-glutamate epimerase-like enolase superfamily enzyme